MFGMRSSLQAAMKRAKREQDKNAKAEARKAAKASRKEGKKKAKPKPKMKIQSALGTLWEDVAKQLTRIDRSVEDQSLDLMRIRSQVEYFDDTIQSHTNHQLLTKLVWKIGGFKRLLREQAAVGGLIYSPKFSSHSGGYSIMCSVCAVEKNGKDYLSLMVCMVRGNYDAHLPWPFAIPIRFRILAQNSQDTDTRNPEMDITKILDCGKANDHTAAFERPTETFGRSVGFRYFTEKETILKEPYLQNDVLFISIAMDKDAVESLRKLDVIEGEGTEATEADLGEVRTMCPVAYSGDRVVYSNSQEGQGGEGREGQGQVVPEVLETAASDDDDDVITNLRLQATRVEEDRRKSHTTFT